MRRRRIGGLAACLTAAACVGSTAADEQTVVHGYQRLAALGRHLAAGFADQAGGVQPKVEELSADVGGLCLVESGCDIVLLDRPLLPEERECIRRVRGRAPMGYPIARDALVVVVHPDNPLEHLHMDQLEGIVDYRLRSWASIGVAFTEAPTDKICAMCRYLAERMQQGEKVEKQPHEHQAFIDVFTLDRDTGAMAVLSNKMYGGRSFELPRRRFTDSSALWEAVKQEQIAIGVGARDMPPDARVVGLSLVPEGVPLKAEPEAVRSGAYPLSHFTYLYVLEGADEGVTDFAHFALSSRGQRLIESSGLGFVALPFVDPPTSGDVKSPSLSVPGKTGK